MIYQLILLTTLRPHDAYPVYCPCTLQEHHQPGKYLIMIFFIFIWATSIDKRGYVNLYKKILYTNFALFGPLKRKRLYIYTR